MTDYGRIHLTEEDMRERRYTRYLGGGEAQWDRRGAFQLELLRELGLRADHGLLDFGCGPLRAGRFFVAYLNEGCYCGVDFNASFIEVARGTVQAEGLAGRRPRLEVVQDFDVASLRRKFDFVLAFSVLNHCSAAQRPLFFARVASAMHTSSRLFVTHGAWFDAARVPTLPLRLLRQHVSSRASIYEHGWAPGETVYPVLEFGLGGAS